MQSTIFSRSLSFVSSWCAILAVLSASALHAAEFKPFVTINVAGPAALANVVESVSALVDPNDTAGIKPQLAPYKNLPGVHATNTIGLAVAASEDSPFGVDVVVVLPISNFQTFNIPGIENALPGFDFNVIRAMARPQGNKLVFATPFMEFSAYQKPGYFVLATEGAADFAAAVDPKTLLAGLDQFTLGIRVDMDNLTEENIEMILGAISMLAAMQGADFNPEDILDMFAEGDMPASLALLADLSSMTMGFTLDPRTMNTTVSTLQVPKKDTELAKKILNVKNTRTKFNGFLHDTPKTIYSFSYLDYLTDPEIAEFDTVLELLSEGFLEGMLEAVEDEGGDGEAAALFAEALIDWITDAMDYFKDNRLTDSAMSLDSDGTLLYALAIDPALVSDFAEQLFSLVPLLGGLDEKTQKQGEAIKQHIEGKIKWDYETVAGYSLSGVPNIFADLPEDAGSPEELAVIQKIPLSVYWAVKEDEAVALAIGLDKTEATFKTALQASAAPAQPKHTGVLALKPLGEFLQKQILPLIETFGADESDITQAKDIFAKLAAVDAGAKMTISQEFPDGALLQKFHLDGKFWVAIQILMQPAIEAAQGAAKRMQCSNHLKMIGLAIHTYHDAHNALPPLYTVDASGKPLQSWRMLILPYIEENKLYDEMIQAGALTKPWDHEDMKPFHNRMPAIFGCPDNPGAGCTYSAIAGEGFIPAPAANRFGGHSFAALTNGTSNTLAIVEVKQPFNWMDPTADVTLDELAKGINKPDGKVGSFHEQGAFMLMFDGSVRFINDTLQPSVLRTWGSVRGATSVRDF